MIKASPVKMRKALELANGYKEAGLLFVAVPVIDSDDHKKLIGMVAERLEKICAECEVEE